MTTNTYQALCDDVGIKPRYFAIFWDCEPDSRCEFVNEKEYKTLEERELDFQQSLRNKDFKIKQLEKNFEFDVRLIKELATNHSIEKFIKTHGERTIQQCYAWRHTERFMNIFFPDVWCKVITIEKGVHEWQCGIKINGKLSIKIDPLKIKLHELKKIIKEALSGIN